MYKTLHLVGALSLTFACADDSSGDDPPTETNEATTGTSSGDGDGDPSTGDGDGDPSTGDGDGDPSTGDGDGDPSTGDGDGDPSTGDGDGDPSTGGDGDGDPCHNNIVLMGYWPPTNEMLRQWSTNPEQNPDGWAGEDWLGLGYDVYAFFPEFPPDGDPSNDDIGDLGAVGSADSDLRVDYQDTSEDFWRIVGDYAPAILITTSRGGQQIGWELEAIEGGHDGGSPDPAQDWYSDGFGPEQLPTQASVDPRSWAGISTYRQGLQLPSQLPLEPIRVATEALNLTNVEIDPETSGNFLSGFLALHGLLYNLEAPHNLAAGHIHVGFGLPAADAKLLIETTLEVVLAAHPLDCGADE